MSGSRIGLTTLKIDWGAIWKEPIKSVSRGYVVFVGENKTLVNSSVLSLVLKEINLRTSTCVQVAAFTKAGYGQRSDCIDIAEGKKTWKQERAELIRR